MRKLLMGVVAVLTAGVSFAASQGTVAGWLKCSAGYGSAKGVNAEGKERLSLCIHTEEYALALFAFERRAWSAKEVVAAYRRAFAFKPYQLRSFLFAGEDVAFSIEDYE